MSHPFVVLIAFGLTVGLPAYYVLIKRWASAQPEGIAGGAFLSGSVPDAESSDAALLSAIQRSVPGYASAASTRSTAQNRSLYTAYQIVSGLYKPGAKLDASGSERNGQKVLIATSVSGAM